MDAYTYEYAVPLTLPASSEKAFAALSEESALEAWFTEHAQVEPRVGGAFRFWGKYTYGAATRAHATQRLTAYDPARSLSFTWTFLGRDSMVEWALSEAEGGVKITVRQAFDSLPEGVRVKELIDDLWRIHTGNLFTYLSGAGDVYRPDFDDPHPEVRQTILIDAPPEKVFAALTTPEYISKWFPAPAPVVEPRVGGKYGFGFSYEVDGKKVEPPPMTILEFEPNRKLAFTWPDWRGDASVPDQKVTWILDEESGKTRLTLIHSGFTRSADVSDYPFGWLEFMRQIGKVSEEI